MSGGIEDRVIEPFGTAGVPAGHISFERANRSARDGATTIPATFFKVTVVRP